MPMYHPVVFDKELKQCTMRFEDFDKLIKLIKIWFEIDADVITIFTVFCCLQMMDESESTLSSVSDIDGSESEGSGDSESDGSDSGEEDEDDKVV